MTTKVAVPDARPKTNDECKVAINQLFVEMKHMADEMVVTRRRIEKSRAETEAALARLEATLDVMERQRRDARVPYGR